MKIDDRTRTDDGGISFSAEVYKTHLKKAEKDGKPVDTQNTEDNSPAYIIDINDIEDTHQKMTVNISKEVLDRYKESVEKAFKLSPESMEAFKNPKLLVGEGVSIGYMTEYTYAIGVYFQPDDVMIHDVKKYLEEHSEPYRVLKSLMENPNPDIDYYNKAFAKATEDTFYTKGFTPVYSDKMFDFMKDISRKTNKSVIGNLYSGAGYDDNKYVGDYTAYYSYNKNLVTVSSQMLYFMSNNRQDDDVWANFVNGKYSDMNEVAQALQNKGDTKAAQTMRDNLSKSQSTTSDTKFRNEYNNNIWELIKAQSSTH